MARLVKVNMNLIGTSEGQAHPHKSATSSVSVPNPSSCSGLSLISEITNGRGYITEPLATECKCCGNTRTWCSEAHLGILKCPYLGHRGHHLCRPVTPGSSSGANKVTANGELLWVPVQEEVFEHLRSHCSLDAVLTLWTVPIPFYKSPLSRHLWTESPNNPIFPRPNSHAAVAPH